MKKFSLPAFIILIAAMALGLQMIQKCEPGDVAADYFVAYDLAKQCGVVREKNLIIR